MDIIVKLFGTQDAPRTLAVRAKGEFPTRGFRIGTVNSTTRKSHLEEK